MKTNSCIANQKFQKKQLSLNLYGLQSLHDEGRTS